ncbi:hypothetical protein ABPG77_010577 [Micractinium sp. CCAP 211/92]
MACKDYLQDGGSVAELAKSMCPASNFFGEDFIMGGNIINLTVVESSPIKHPSCSCTASVGPLNGTFFVPGTCLHSDNAVLNGSMSSLYSRQQPGETWMGGILLAPGDTQTITESAAEASDYTQYLGKPRMHLCRQVAGGSLKLSFLYNPLQAGPDLTFGQQVNYTGIELDDGKGGAWAVILAGNDLYMYPAASLKFCPPGDAGQGVSYTAVWSTDNTTTQCSSFNLTAVQVNETDYAFYTNRSATLTAPQGNLLVQPAEVQAYRDQLCASPDTANVTLAADIAAGGAAAQKAFLALSVGNPDGNPYSCPQGELLADAFINYAGGPGSTLSLLTELAQQFVDAAASAGIAACVTVAVFDLPLTKVYNVYTFHTPPGSSSGLLPNGTVRLTNSCTEGRADVVVASSWSAVCSWGGGGEAVHQRNAQVICRGQGLPSTQPIVSAQANVAGADIWIKDLNCTGSESNIMDCPHTMADGSSYGSQDCLALSVTCVDAGRGMPPRQVASAAAPLAGALAISVWHDGGSLLDQVKSACPRFSYYGEDFLMGVNLINATNTQSVGECCSSCTGDCFRWTWCPTTSTDGCTASAGPLNSTLFPAGTCIHSNNNGLNNTMLITYSKQQPGEPWVSGIMAAPGTKPVSFETAATAQDFTEYLSSANASWYLCRQVAGGSLKLSALFEPTSTSITLTQGQQVNYTGIQLDDGAGNPWAVVLAGPGPDPYMYPAADLAFCPQGQAGSHQQCTANLFGSATEEGASCAASSACCSSLVCHPRAVRDLLLLWSTYAGADQSRNFTVSPGQPWSPLPNECVREYSNLGGAATFIATTWATDNATVECSTLNLTALQSNDSANTWTRNASSTWAAPDGNLLVDAGAVQAYRDQLCANLDTANATLAADVAAGGATAQTAYLAMFVGNPDGGPYACPQGVRLAQLFVDFATAGNATITSVTEQAQQLVDAAASTGSAACVNIAVLTADETKVVQTYEIHTPAGASSGLPNGTVRLSGDQSCTQGAVDVIMAGSWGAVCSWSGGGDAVNQRNAQVVCRGQGLPSTQPTVSAQANVAGHYIWIKDLNCTGSESSILDCPHTMADGTAAGSQDCLALTVTCADGASADAAASAMCTARPGRCQQLPGSCDPAQGYCAFEPQPAGTPCLGGVCDASGQCVSAAS